MKNKIETRLSKIINEVEASNIVAPELNVDRDRTTWLKQQGKDAEGLSETSMGLSYEDGYKAGHADRLLGHVSKVALTSEHYYYAMGYHDGVKNLPKKSIPLSVQKEGLSEATQSYPDTFVGAMKFVKDETKFKVDSNHKWNGMPDPHAKNVWVVAEPKQKVALILYLKDADFEEVDNYADAIRKYPVLRKERREMQASGVFENADSNLANKFAQMLQTKIEAYYNDFFKEKDPAQKKVLVQQSSNVKVKPGAKYIKIDVGGSGKFMIGPDNHLYFIKGYGVPDLKKDFGDVVKIVAKDFDFDGYSIVPKGSGKRTRYGYAGRIAEGRGNYLNQDIIDDIIEIASKYSTSREIWDERDMMHKDVKDLILSIKSTGFIPENKWSTFVRDVETQMKGKLTPPGIFNIDTAKKEVEKIKKGIKAPVVGAQYSTLGGDNRVSILIVVSLDKKDTWGNGILENSRYMRFHLYRSGVLEQFTLSKIPKKFRKMNARSVDDVIAKINAYISAL